MGKKRLNDEYCGIVHTLVVVEEKKKILGSEKASLGSGKKRRRFWNDRAPRSKALRGSLRPNRSPSSSDRQGGKAGTFHRRPGDAPRCRKFSRQVSQETLGSFQRKQGTLTHRAWQHTHGKRSQVTNLCRNSHNCHSVGRHSSFIAESKPSVAVHRKLRHSKALFRKKKRAKALWVTRNFSPRQEQAP